MTWPPHQMTWHDMTCHSSSPHVTSQPTTLLHPPPPPSSWQQKRQHHHHGTAEGSFTTKKWFGRRAGRSPCAHSIGKILSLLQSFCLLKIPPPARPGTSCSVKKCSKIRIKLAQPTHWQQRGSWTNLYSSIDDEVALRWRMQAKMYQSINIAFDYMFACFTLAPPVPNSVPTLLPIPARKFVGNQ